MLPSSSLLRSSVVVLLLLLLPLLIIIILLPGGSSFLFVTNNRHHHSLLLPPSSSSSFFYDNDNTAIITGGRLRSQLQQQRTRIRMRFDDYDGINNNNYSNHDNDDENNTKRTAAAAVAGLLPEKSITMTPDIDTGNENKNNANENKNIENNKIHYLSNIQKIYCISDLHVDSDENMNWIHNQCHDFAAFAFGENDNSNSNTTSSNSNSNNSNSIIIVAGDISHQLQKIEHTLQLLLDTGAYIVFVPGNHEAWLTKSELDDTNNEESNSNSNSNSNSTATPTSVQQRFNSITKLKQIQNLCSELGVYTTGNCICVNGGDGGNGGMNDNDNENNDNESDENENEEVVWILPLDGWYDGSLSFVDLNNNNEEQQQPPINSSSKSNSVQSKSLDSISNSNSNSNLDSNNDQHEQHEQYGQQHYNLVSDFLKWPWVDFQRCIWPLSLWEGFDELELKESELDTTINMTTTNDDQKQQQGSQSRSRLLKKIPYGLVDYFLQQNQKNMLDVYHNEQHKRHQQQQEQSRSSNTIGTKSTSTTVITVTHFLTNQQSLPDWCNLQESKFNIKEWLEHGVPGISAKFALVAGSSKLDQQLRSIQILDDNGHNENRNELLSNKDCKNKRIHIFGHSHRPKDFIYDGIRYIHNPLGKPRERDMYMINPNISLKEDCLIWEKKKKKNWDDNNNNDDDDDDDDDDCNKRKTIIRYWEQYGGGLKMLQKRMKDQRQLREKQRQQRRNNNT